MRAQAGETPRAIERRAAGGVLRADIELPLEKHGGHGEQSFVHRRADPFLGDEHERVAPALVARVRIGALLEEGAHRVRVTALRGEHHRRRAGPRARSGAAG